MGAIAGYWAATKAWAFSWKIAPYLVIAVLIAALWAVWGWKEASDEKLKSSRKEIEGLISTNQAAMEALDEIKAEKAKNERLLTDRAARKSKEADQLGALVKRILSHDASTDCPVSPSVNDALDGLL